MLNISLDLDKIWVGSSWEDTLGDIMRDTIKDAIYKEVRKAIKEDKDFKNAITLLRKKAAKKVLESLEKE